MKHDDAILDSPGRALGFHDPQLNEHADENPGRVPGVTTRQAQAIEAAIKLMMNLPLAYAADIIALKSILRNKGSKP